MPERASRGGLLSEAELTQRVGELLKQAEKEVPAWNKSAVVGIQGRGVVCGYLEFPELTRKELEVAVLSGVTREVPFPMDSVDVAHIPVEPLREDKTAVFYTAWRKEDAATLRRVLDQADISIRRFESTGVALTRELFRNRELTSDQFYLIVNVGHQFTQFIGVKGGYPYYLRDVPLGGQNITYAIQVGSQTSWGDAEELKRRYPLQELSFAAGPVLKEWAHEMKRSLAYFRRHFRVDEVAAIYFSGGTALLQDLPAYLSEELELPVLLDDWDQLLSKKGGPACLHKVSLGLALGQI